MAKCIKCGAELDAGEKFCGNCGEKVIQKTEKQVKNSDKDKKNLEQKKTNEDNGLNFKIPNNKAELYDYIISTSVNLKYDTGSRDLLKANLEKAYLKAKVLYDEDSSEYKEIKEAYENSNAFIHKENKKTLLFISIACVVIVMIFAGYVFINSMGNQSEITRTSVSSEEVTENLYEGTYICGKDAEVKPGKNFFKYVATCDENEYEYIDDNIWIQGEGGTYAPDDYQNAKKGKVYSINIKKGVKVEVSSDHGEWYYYEESK